MVAGDRLGPYEVLGKLGEGGMGEVYRGLDVRLRRPVAIKILAPHMLRDREAIGRFKREAETASALNHPNILTIYDIGEADTPGHAAVHYIAMELIEGRTLREVMRLGGEWVQLLEWMRQVAAGLAKAHAAGVTHRDLKPDNVMISNDGFAKILDFGLAKLAEQRHLDIEVTAVRAPHTMGGQIVGTVGYMSPEQAAGGTTDFRSDIFSFGCILYELGTRRLPFQHDSVVETLHQVMHAEPPPLGSAVPPGFDRMVLKCLQKRPEVRYQSAADIGRDLADIIASLRARSETTHQVQQRAPGERDGVRAIAVLPFADLSPGRDAAYIGDGLADEISTDLSRLHALRVTARTSAMHYRGTDKPASEIARDLGVEFVLTGSVRVAGGRLRITTQLVEAAADRAIWVDRTDGTLDDIFDIQEKVARAVTSALKVHVSAEESGALRARPLANIHAFECYLRARRHILEMTETSLQEALDDIQRAEQLVGENPLLLASRAYVHWQYYNSGLRPDAQYLDSAEALVARIVELDPRSQQINLLRGVIAFQRSNVVAGIEYLRRAVNTDGSVEALMWLIAALALTGGIDEARSHVARLRQVDPLNWMARLAPVAVEYLSGHFARALEYVADLTPSDLNVSIVSYMALETHAQLGQVAEAATVADAMARHAPNDPFTRMAGLLIAALHGRTDEVRAGLTDDLEVIARADMQYSSWMAELFALIDDRDAAFEFLRNAIDRGFLNHPFLAQHNRLLKGLHADPRFAPLMEDLRRRGTTLHGSAY